MSLENKTVRALALQSGQIACAGNPSHNINKLKRDNKLIIII